jgi:hypothetical protein
MHGQVVLGGKTVQATIGPMISHVIFLSCGLDDHRNCKTRIISFLNSKVKGGQAGGPRAV